MTRYQIINKIGSEYLTSNIENDEFSYKQALKRPFSKTENHFKLDLRFEKDNLSILIETKKDHRKLNNKDIDQLIAYSKLEREFRKNNNIISILYNIKTEEILIWKNDEKMEYEEIINDIQYYLEWFNNRKNDKNSVIDATNELNNDLHAYGINESLRSQFVGCLLVALNNHLEFSIDLKTDEINNRIKKILQDLIGNDEQREIKTNLLIKILNEQPIRDLKSENYISLLNKLNKNLIPYINSKTSKGEDLLNLFFTTFNKYVGKSDKNQAFTPTHITDFMCDITNLNINSRVLDPTCGSGSFLVQAMAKMIHKTNDNNSKKREEIKKDQLFGIEKYDGPFGLATTNMMIHEDGKSNIIKASCFDKAEWIREKNINLVLMNPPFNGQEMPKDCPINKKKNMDATKGLYFVDFVANTVNKGMLATVLPLQCAIGSDSSVSIYKKKMLKNHTLKAVFSLPNEIFHPGASVNTCIMLFELGVPHDSKRKTFFGYFKEDGFVKKKNKGRVEKIEWEKTKKIWLDSFYNLKEIPGLSVLKEVTHEDEWLAEAYMETDYSRLKEEDFIQTIRDFISFKVKNGDINEK